MNAHSFIYWWSMDSSDVAYHIFDVWVNSMFLLATLMGWCKHTVPLIFVTRNAQTMDHYGVSSGGTVSSVHTMLQ